MNRPTTGPLNPLRLHLSRQRISSELEERNKATAYLCPVCVNSANPYARQRAKYEDFDLVSLLDPFTGTDA